MIFVPTNFMKGSMLYDKQQKFISWAQKELGETFILSKPEFGYEKHPNKANAFSEIGYLLSKHKLNQSIKINLTGELKGQCINTTYKNLEELLKRRNIQKITKKILKSAKTNKDAFNLLNAVKQKKLKIFSLWRKKTQPRQKRKI